jgi:hypothetical protein
LVIKAEILQLLGKASGRYVDVVTAEALEPQVVVED